LVPLELEANMPEYLNVARSRIFPCDACMLCCPSWLLDRFVPAPFRRVQGWTHLLLLLGVYASVCLLGWTILKLLQHMKTKEFKEDFAKDMVALFFTPPCLFYFLKTIRQYDQDLRLKKREVQIQRARLMDDFQKALGCMDDFLCETTHTNLGFAERGFETKRREFQRFLDRMKDTCGSDVVITQDSGDSKLLAELRNFCLCWFRVFAECSIDPVHAPRLIASEVEMKKCATVAELCDLCLVRLKAAEVQFISSQKQKDAKLCDDTRGAFHRITEEGSFVMAHHNNWSGVGNIFPLLKGVSWISFYCCTRARSGPSFPNSRKDRYPKVIGFFCGHCVLLSREHVMLLCGFLLGLIVLSLEFVLDTSKRMIFLLGAIQWCNLVVLARFEEIDIVQQLEQEVWELEKEKISVHVQHETMKEFWSKAQQLTDLWLYRTIPRLNLYSEIHGCLEDVTFKQLCHDLQRANKQLHAFEHSLPRIEAWRTDGDLAQTYKKQFREALDKVCHERGFNGVLAALEKQQCLPAYSSPFVA